MENTRRHLTGREKKSLWLLLAVGLGGGMIFYYVTHIPTLSVPAPIADVVVSTGLDQVLPKSVVNAITYTKIQNPLNIPTVAGQNERLSVSSVQDENDLQRLENDVESTDLSSLDSEYEKFEESAK